MKFKFIYRSLILATLTATLAAPLAAQEGAPEDLRKQVQALQEELARLQAQGSAGERLQELERRIDLLAAEIEKMRTGGAVEAQPIQSVPGFAPAASKVYRTARGVSIGGYGEATYQNFASERQDRSASGRADRLDMLRAVLYVGHKFSDTILFNSEIEFEHASTGEGAEEKGEVSIEQAYLDLKPWKSVGLRAGMVLVPVGFLNELHEPPVFHGARRNSVETAILPSTWREVGIGLFGENGPFQWRAFAVASLSAEGFAAGGIREGRQQGSDSLAEDLALTGRLDFTGVPGLTLGGSFFTGNTGQGAAVDGRRIEGRLNLFDLHVQYERRGLQIRGLYARSTLDDAGLINEQNGLSGRGSVGERQRGWFLEAAYDVMTLRPAGTWAVVPFVRLERLDPQAAVPAGFEKNPAQDRRAWTAGVGVKPLPSVVLKADYQWLSNHARTGTNQLNLAIGYLF
jgi:uncharacterized small protein (DUF1192 family)